MTRSPQSLLAVRQLFMQRTGLPAVALGIQHYKPDGGGYHEGNDLLAVGGRLNTDYSKRESERDRPGSDLACAIDIGRFKVDSPTGPVDNRRMTVWLLKQIDDDTEDSRWIREIIYSLDGKTVKRYDRLRIRTGGDKSHLSHEHVSSFRDDIESPHVLGLFTRFWREMDGLPAVKPVPASIRKGKPVIVYFRTSSRNTGTPVWALVGAGNGPTNWVETNSSKVATGWAKNTISQGSIELTDDEWVTLMRAHTGTAA